MSLKIRTSICDDFSSPTTIEQNIFQHLRRFCFLWNCSRKDCACRHLFDRLLKEMAQLESLCASGDLFNSVQIPVSTIKRLELREYDSISLDSLPERLPHLSSLLLSGTFFFFDPFPYPIVPLFLRLSNLTFIALKITFDSPVLPVQYRIRAQEALLQVQAMDSSLRQMKRYL